jgi:hypothetical protein
MGRMSRLNEVRKAWGVDRKTWEGQKEALTPPELESSRLLPRDNGWF